MSRSVIPPSASAPPGRRHGAASRRGPARTVVVPFFLAACLTTTAWAQTTAASPPGNISTGIIAGTVADSLAAPVAGAQASLVGFRGHGTSDSDGTFRLGGIQPGEHILVVRRIGFRPESVTVQVTAGVVSTANVRLSQNALWIAPVVIEARTAKYTGRLRGFYERRDRGIGQFFTAADIEARNPRAVTDLLRTVPGTRVIPNGGQNVVTFRDRTCLPLVWLDGSPASAAYLDPDLFEPTSLAGIEVYKGVATIPGALMGTRGKGSCGVIALWTKMPDPKPRSSAKPVTAEDLANLVASLRLHTADQVDVAAAADSGRPVVPVYPDALLSAGVPGRVVVEFVVDTTGQADMNTFGTVTTTHDLFTQAVRRAVASARFTPARLAGRPVLQLMQLPFSFTVPKP